MATSQRPLMTLPENEMEVEGMMSPTVVVLDSASPCAIALGRYPSLLIASSTLFLVSSLTTLEPLMTLETVASETLDSLATS